MKVRPFPLPFPARALRVRSWSAIVLVLLAVFLSLGCGADSPSATGTTSGTVSGSAESGEASGAGAGEARVVFRPDGGAEATLWVETARTSSERARGLMYRKQLDPDRGMIFIYEETTTGMFWMKNTPIPLSIAFLDSGGQVIDIQDMQPYSEQLHAPAGPYVYAVEANQGWFAGHGVTVGDNAEFFED